MLGIAVTVLGACGDEGAPVRRVTIPQGSSFAAAAGASESAQVRKLRRATLLVCIANGLGLSAGMGDSAIHRRSHLLRVFPEITRTVIVTARLPLHLALGKFVVGQLHTFSLACYSGA